MANLKILVIATQKSALAARIAITLADVGFHVAALTPYGHPVRRSRKVRNHFTYCRWFWLKLTMRALVRWSPAFIVCADDQAVRRLQRLHQRMSSDNDKVRSDTRKLIELSLGAAVSFPVASNKSEFLLRAANEGLRCPRTIVIPATGSPRPLPPDATYPIVVKADHSFGGICVRIVNTDAALRSAVWELQTPPGWHGLLRRFVGAILGLVAVGPLTSRLRRTICLQNYVHGRPGNRAVLCWRGKVLAGISVEAAEVKTLHGPASVVRVIDHPEMESAANHMVRCLNLSGFIGFDFILDPSNQAWIIEMNPRVTPICHLSIMDGTNLPAVLYSHLSGQRPPPRAAPFTSELIALFPDELIRSPSSEYLRRCRHDVPWSEPEVMYSVLRQALRTGVLGRLRAIVERSPSMVAVLTRFGIMTTRPQT